MGVICRRLCLAASVVAALAFCGTRTMALAQEATAESLAASKQLMVLIHADQTIDQVIQMMAPQISQLLVHANPERGQAVRKIVDEMLVPAMRESLPEAVGEIAAVYARNFTADELNAVIAFYESPVGKKFIERQPQLLTELAKIGQVWGQKTALKVLRDLAPKLKEQGIEVPI